MIPLLSERWASLEDAYGSATELSRCLAKGPTEILASSDPCQLWSKLYHQGEIFSASYAAVPYLLDAQFAAAQPSWSVIALCAAIHVAHLEGHGPLVAADVWQPYNNAVLLIPAKLSRFIVPGLDDVPCRAILAASAAACGNVALARVLLDITPELAQRFIDEWRFAD